MKRKMKNNKRQRHFSCYCTSCKNGRLRLKILAKENTAISYHIQSVLKEVLGLGNY